MEFRWNGWNLEHVSKHGVDWDEAERVVENAVAPYPERREDDKWRVVGQERGGRFIQVVYLVDEDDTVYIIHARPLTEAEKRRYRRRLR